VAAVSVGVVDGSPRLDLDYVLDSQAEVDLNVAANDIREAVSRIQNRLPDAVDPPRVVKADSDASAIMQISVVSPTLAIDELTAVTDRVIVDRLAGVDGVADVSVWGARGSEITVRLDQTALASRGLTAGDLETALNSAGLDAPAGTLDTGGGTLTVRANAALESADEIAAIRLPNGIRIGDVAEVTFGPEDRSSSIRRGGDSGIALGIVRQAGSNTLEISAGVRAAVDDLQQTLTQDVDIAVTSDDAVFINGAVQEVAVNLMIATLIVITVIFLFLRSWRTTLIPAVTVPVALIGTVAGIWLMGFSINILTLLALVLATGMVVDDAIVILENIERHKRLNMSARAAAVLGTRQVFFAVLATTATLIAVFVPISMMPGTAGALFAEFGFVLAVAVSISTFVALTLAPMMAARTGPPPTGGGALAAFGTGVATLYRRALDLALKAPLVVVAGFLALGFLAVATYGELPEQLTPDEDRGVIRIFVSAPDGASLEYTESQIAYVEGVVQPLIDSGEVENMLTISGWGGGTRGFVTLQLADWGERDRSQADITREIDQSLANFAGARISTRTGNSLGIRGGGQGLRAALTGPDYDSLVAAGDDFVRALEMRGEAVASPSLDFDATQPELSVRIDRERAADLNVPLESVSATVQAVLDGRTVTELSIDDRMVPIRLTAGDDTISGPADLESIFISSRDGRVLPLSSLVTMEEVPSAPELEREAQQRAVSISAQLASDFPLSEGVAEMRAIAAETLPPGISLIFMGDAAAMNETGNSFIWTLGFAVLIVLLVLAAQFESINSAIVIMTTVPFGLGAAVFAMALTGGSLNLYSQIGLIMIVGLMAKNGILVVEFANQLRDRGQETADAIREACGVRFRPVMMTLVSTVLGGLPLILSGGPGAEARQALGWIIVGGLGLSTVVTLFLTPVMFSLIARFAKPRAAEGAALERELQDAGRRGLGAPVPETARDSSVAESGDRHHHGNGQVRHAAE
jgi:HAE1 family hydrophobic/amphiphilic exporter-1